EAAAIAAYARLTRNVLPRGSRPSLWTVLRIDLATLSVSHLVPGGAAAGSTLGYRLLGQAGLDGGDRPSPLPHRVSGPRSYSTCCCGSGSWSRSPCADSTPCTVPPPSPAPCSSAASGCSLLCGEGVR